MVMDLAATSNLAIAAAGTHPFSCWTKQAITPLERYVGVQQDLQDLAQQLLIFGTHIHVGIEGADRAIYVADGIRRYLPLLLALSANSPFWRGKATGMMSTRTAIFRAFPRAGIPPHYGTWEIFSNRVELMMRAGAIEDYTYLWFDVRPHPNLGTVETRVFDQMTRVEHTISMAALVASIAHRLCALFDAEEPLIEYPTELVDDNKVRAALRGVDGKLIDFRRGERATAPEMAHKLIDLVADHADELDCRAEVEGIADLLQTGTGAHRQLELYERTGDMHALVAEIAEKSRV
jgi:carboxylate-amine ligase